MSDLPGLLAQIEWDKGPWVLVTLVEARGSTYRKAGAHLLVHAGGYLGMLSGGCLEAEVLSRCAPVLDGRVEFLETQVDTRRLLGCQGTLTLLAERLPRELAAQVTGAAEARQPLDLFSDRAGSHWKPTSSSPRPGAFAHRILPPLKLLVFGAGPGVPPLLQMAHTLGWQGHQVVLAHDPAVVRRPQEPWLIVANAAALRRGWVDARTCCVVMNHHVGRDYEVLHALWNTPTPFLGLLGSRRRRDQILEQLSFAATDPVDLESRRLYSPVGLDLGAEGAAEIALEVAAQVQRVMSAKQEDRASQNSALLPLPTPTPSPRLLKAE